MAPCKGLGRFPNLSASPVQPEPGLLLNKKFPLIVNFEDTTGLAHPDSPARQMADGRWPMAGRGDGERSAGRSPATALPPALAQPLQAKVCSLDPRGHLAHVAAVGIGLWIELREA